MDSTCFYTYYTSYIFMYLFVSSSFHYSIPQCLDETMSAFYSGLALHKGLHQACGILLQQSRQPRWDDTSQQETTPKWIQVVTLLKSPRKEWLVRHLQIWECHKVFLKFHSKIPTRILVNRLRLTTQVCHPKWSHLVPGADRSSHWFSWCHPRGAQLASPMAFSNTAGASLDNLRKTRCTELQTSWSSVSHQKPPTPSRSARICNQVATMRWRDLVWVQPSSDMLQRPAVCSIAPSFTGRTCASCRSRASALCSSCTTFSLNAWRCVEMALRWNFSMLISEYVVILFRS